MVRVFLPCNYGKQCLLFSVCLLLCATFSFAQNPIVTENNLTGNPKSEWDITGSGDANIQGFATDISVNKGQTVRFKINVNGGGTYAIRIYRLGYYKGNGARLITTLGTSFQGVTQPPPITNTSTGLVDCSTWSESASWAVPSTAVSGVYIARLTRSSGSSHIVFIVRDDAGTQPILFKTSDATWQAYNIYGGNSLYVGATSYPGGHATKVSYNRPFLTRAGGGGGGAMEDWIFNAEYPMIRFLERNGYNVSYTTDVDMDRDATPITPATRKIFLSVGHDEYWSANERTKVENARNAGVHLAFFSGNEVYWKTRWEDNNRTLVCYKEGSVGENVCGSKCDPTSAWTGLWREGCAYPGGGACKPENALTGQISWSDITSTITVPAAYKNLRFWRNTSVANLSNNGVATFTAGTLGYEWNYEQFPQSMPSGRITLSSTTVSGMTHKLSLYRHSSGALVFGAGTVQWSWGLDNIHDRGSAAANTAMQQATVNLFADMGVQPGSIMSGLSLATASTDFTPPAPVITSPANNASISAGSLVVISGTCTDVGGQIAGVEVSVDGGNTWAPATGTSSWTYSWTPGISGTLNIRVRGFDDSGNMSTPGATGSASNINVTVSGGAPQGSYTIFQASSVPQIPLENDGSGIVLGVKFRTTQPGFISALRFYKGAGTSGTHTGTLWSSTGTKLAEVTFNNETGSGWQQAMLQTPYPIAANTTYIASYHSSSGDYCSSNPYFTSATVNGPIKALANGEDGPNGLYQYSATNTFPSSNFQSSNYFVDVVFTNVTDNTPPQVSTVTPANNATGVSLATTATAVFNEDMSAASINGSTVEVRDPSSALIAATVSYNVGTRTVTITPTSPLTFSTAYTVRILGGSSGVKDLAGNALASNYSWTFTTLADNIPPTVTSASPANGTSNVNINVAVSAVFNEAMNAASISASSVELRTASAVLVPATVSYNAANRTVTLTPSSLLSESTAYTLTIKSGAAGVKDVAGNALVNDFTSSFTTIAAADLTPPQVTTVTPANNAINVALNTTATVTFNEPMSAASITTSSVELRNGANALVPATVSYNVGNLTVTLTPSAALENNITYTVIVKSGASGVKDVAGNALTSDYTWSFTSVPDQVPPVVSAVTPLNGATSVATTTAVTGQFNEAMSAASFTSSSFELRDAGNTLVPATISYNAANRTATLTPLSVLSNSAVYTAILKSGATGVKDVAGNALTNDYVWTFTTVSNIVTVFSPSSVPAVPRENDGTPIVLGMKFRATQSGSITGVRFYKGAGATGTHTGTLWSSTGTKLAEVVFQNETASGWQQALFTTPYAITANTTYVVSYHSSSGDYANTNPYFTTATVNGPLRGLANGEDGPNGLYRYSTTVAFPNENYQTSNYWVDVVFSPGPPPDVTPPTVSSVTPTNNATGVLLNIVPTAVFSENMNGATVNAATVELRNASNTLIPSAISYNAVSRTVSVTPNAPLSSGAVYTVRIIGGTNGVKDAAGNALATTYTWSFTTLIEPDVTPPTVTTVTPANASTGVALGTSVTAVFSEAMTAATINATNFEVRDASNALVAGTVSYNVANRTVTFVPTASLAYNVVYTATVKQGVSDLSGNQMTSNYSWSFTTLADLVPPTVTGVTPANGANTVAINSAVNIVFSEAMDVASINSSTIEIRNGGNPINGVVTYNENNRTATFTASENLAYSTQFSVVVNAGASGVKDVNGNPIANPFTSTFTTVPEPDLTAPVVTLATPAQGSTGIAISGAAFTASFSEAMNASTINTSTVELRDGANALVAAGVSYNASTFTVTVTPGSPLLNSTLYTVRIKGSTTGVKDLSGNALAADYSWSFTTEADVVAPLVTSVTPSNNASGIGTATTMTVVFNEPMTVSSINTGTIEVRNAGSVLINTTVTYNATTRTATITPVSPLTNSTTFTVTVMSGAAGVKDLAGNALANNYSWSFNTAESVFTVFQPTNVPAVFENDGSAITLGMKFRSTNAGFVTGVRFYKGPGTTGTHTGTLWSSTGTKLAEVVFTNETASGWQQMKFLTPYQIAANTTYMVSYHSSSGDYANTNPYFSSAVVNGPLRALANGEDGPNGMYRYSTTPAFPNSNWQTSNYWVDVVFETTLGPDVTPPTVNSVTPFNNASNVATNLAQITATMSEAMDASTLNASTIEVRDNANNVIPVNVSTTQGVITIQPATLFFNSTLYTVRLKGGSAGIKDVAGNALAADYTWSFTTADPPPLVTSNGNGGPILVVYSPSNPFSRYTIEMLRAEGFNSFLAKEISQVTAGDLENYDVTIIGEVAVNAAQATMFTDWVNAGGTLIAFRPGSQLTSLLGITKAAGVQTDQYILVNTTSGPGVGIVNQTMQFHGTADRYTLNGATSLATLYSNATTATTYPAVTLREVGTNGGKAIAFTYDLARSIVYTRQGNPAWEKQKRDGTDGPIRSDDLFFGGSSTDWVNLNKVAIPQADEQQRLLTNIILQSNLHKKPLPRFWFLPRGLKAAIVMTGDDHARDGTTGRFNQYLTLGPNTAQDVADWKAIRGTSYLFNNTPITNAEAVAFEQQGFEISLHTNTDCVDIDSVSFNSYLSTQINSFRTQFPGVTPPTTHRTHCMAWSDWASVPKVQAKNGVRFDVNYYYWPGDWIQNRSGMFTGSGMPMRFADLDGSLIDCYQAPTQMTDESNILLPTFANELLDRALGSQGYYGVFVANMHTDTANHIGSNRIIASALARNVPVISAKQMLTWLDGRNGSYFGAMTWSNNQLSFPVTGLVGARNLKTMLPYNSQNGQLQSVTMNGNTIPFTVETIKGIQYGFIDITTGTNNYVATYSGSGNRGIVSAALPDSTSATVGVVVPAAEGLAAGVEVVVNPNPTSTYFNLQIRAGGEGAVTVRILDMTGKVVERHEKVAPSGVLRLGDTWKNGTYFAEVTQGDVRKVVKIMKIK